MRRVKSWALFQIVLTGPLLISGAQAAPQRIVPPLPGHLYQGLYYDVALPGSDDVDEHNVTPADIQRYEAATGQKTAWVYFSQNWYESRDFPTAMCGWITGLGKTPYIRLMTWSTQDATHGDKVYATSDIAAGKYDGILRAWGKAAAAFGSPVLVEWGTECNGDWFPWNGKWARGTRTSKETEQQGAAVFVKAYRHIVALTREEGANNLTWVWHVNPDDVPDAPWNALEKYYPGDEFVDWIATSNYGARTPGEKEDLPLFRDQMDAVYARLMKVAPAKPMIVAEFGCTAGNPRQAAAPWARAALEDLLANRWPRVIGFCWWNESWENDGKRAHDTDMIVMHSPELTKAFQEELDHWAGRIEPGPRFQ